MSTLKIGIECESIEGKNSDLPAGRQVFGVGRMIMKLLEEISRRPELEKEYRFVLYFKDNVPDFAFLKASIFETKRVPVPFFSAKGGSASGGKNRLFPIYYFALLPMRLWFDRPDVMFWPNYMLPIIAFGRSLVTLTEDVYYETYEGKLPFRYRLAYGIFGWWTAKFATKIMAISKTSKKNLVKLYNINPGRIVVDYLGIDFVKNEKPSFAKAAEGQQTKDSYLLFVGQMFPRRHAKETILAFEKFVTDNTNSQILKNLGISDLKLILVGPDKYEVSTIGPLVSKVNEQLRRQAVIHKDYVSNEELTELYSGAKALVYVSDREAFGLPPMEALSFGVPPIIADNELGHELFEDYAFYSKSGDVDDIAETIKRTLTDIEKISKIKSGGSEFVKKYNWKNFADRWLKIIDEI